MRGALTIAVPRGALFGETLDLLDRLGIETAEVRANDRKLLFEEAGIVTMRPSDVPTYVEHGAADIGITGKDVLLEAPDRDVYELLDLGFGRCRRSREPLFLELCHVHPLHVEGEPAGRL